MSPDLGRQRDHTSEGDEIALLLLGALAQLDAFAAAAEAPGPPAAVGDEPLIAAALGLLSLRRSLRRWALQAASEAPPAPAPQPAPPPRRGALR